MGWLARRRAFLAGTVSLFALLVAPAALSAPPGSGSSLPPGCSADSPATAFHSDGSSPPSRGGPVSCAVTTGFGGSESRIAVAPNGNVLETPAIDAVGLGGTALPLGHLPDAPRPDNVVAQNSGIGLSQDQGGSWQLIKANGNYCPQGDNDLYIDRVTGRLFYSCIFAPLPPPANQFSAEEASGAAVLSSPASPAGYTRWESNTMYGYSSENPRFTSAPAPTGQTPPVPGERMAYWCANIARTYSSSNRTCYRSFDGGASWQFASVLASGPVPQHSECGTNPEQDSAPLTIGSSLDGNYPQGAADGSLWVKIQCGGVSYLARSTDEGSTWPILHRPNGSPMTIPGSPRELRVDTEGNLYAVEVNGNSLLLRTSRDGGQTWSAPLDMTAPAARAATPASGSSGNPAAGVVATVQGKGGGTPSAINKWGAAIGYQPGVVAVSYLVDRPGGGYDGYVSVTHDALDPSPVFYASMINPPSRPMLSTTGGAQDFISLDVGPDGTPWAGFYSDCIKSADGSYADPYCQQTQNTQVPSATGVGPAYGMTIGSLRWH